VSRRSYFDRAYHERNPHPRAEPIARQFHEAYERLAPEFGYRTREESARPWDEVPSDNRRLMIATVTDLLNRGIFR
jgi:hypothetical protein